MRQLIAFFACLISLSTYAMSDKEVCEAYGVALATNSTDGRVQFMSEMKSRIENQTWTLSPERCNEFTQESKHKFDFNLAIQTWSDSADSYSD